MFPFDFKNIIKNLIYSNNDWERNINHYLEIPTVEDGGQLLWYLLEINVSFSMRHYYLKKTFATCKVDSVILRNLSWLPTCVSKSLVCAKQCRNSFEQLDNDDYQRWHSNKIIHELNYTNKYKNLIIQPTQYFRMLLSILASEFSSTVTSVTIR